MKELIKKTGNRMIGICKGVNEFVSKKNGATYWSVDLEVKGSKNAINIQLPDGFDRSVFREYELCQVDLCVERAFQSSGYKLTAIKPS